MRGAPAISCAPNGSQHAGDGAPVRRLLLQEEGHARLGPEHHARPPALQRLQREAQVGLEVAAVVLRAPARSEGDVPLDERYRHLFLRASGRLAAGEPGRAVDDACGGGDQRRCDARRQQPAPRRTTAPGEPGHGEPGVGARQHEADAVHAGQVGDLRHRQPADLRVAEQGPRVADEERRAGEEPASAELRRRPGRGQQERQRRSRALPEASRAEGERRVVRRHHDGRDAEEEEPADELRLQVVVLDGPWHPLADRPGRQHAPHPAEQQRVPEPDTPQRDEEGRQCQPGQDADPVRRIGEAEELRREDRQRQRPQLGSRRSDSCFVGPSAAHRISLNLLGKGC